MEVEIIEDFQKPENAEQEYYAREMRNMYLSTEKRML